MRPVHVVSEIMPFFLSAAACPATDVVAEPAVLLDFFPIMLKFLSTDEFYTNAREIVTRK